MTLKRFPAFIAGWQHHPAAVEDRQEGHPQRGVESHPGGPEGHGRSANAARGESQRSSEGGEKRAHEAARETTKKPLLTCAAEKKKEKAMSLASRWPWLWELWIVWSSHLYHHAAVPVQIPLCCSVLMTDPLHRSKRCWTTPLSLCERTVFPS